MLIKPNMAYNAEVCEVTQPKIEARVIHRCDLGNLNRQHEESLRDSIVTLLDEFVDAPEGAELTDDGLFEYTAARLAEYYDIYPPTRLSDSDWVRFSVSDRGQHPFLGSCVYFLAIERRRPPDEAFNANYILPLLSFAQDGSNRIHVNSLPAAERDGLVTDTCAYNDLILILAAQIAKEDRIVPTQNRQIMFSTGLPFYALSTAARILHHMIAVYRIGKWSSREYQEWELEVYHYGQAERKERVRNG